MFQSLVQAGVGYKGGFPPESDPREMEGGWRERRVTGRRWVEGWAQRSLVITSPNFLCTHYQ